MWRGGMCSSPRIFLAFVGVGTQRNDLEGRQAHPALRLHDAKPCHAKPWVTCNVASSMRLPQGGTSIALPDAGNKTRRNLTQRLPVTAVAASKAGEPPGDTRTPLRQSGTPQRLHCGGQR